MTKIAREAIDLLLAAISTEVGDDGMLHQFSASGRTNAISGIYVTNYFSLRKSITAALFIRQNGAQYLRDLSVETIRSMLSDFIIEHYPIIAGDVVFKTIRNSFADHVSEGARDRLATALDQSALFKPKDEITLFPLVAVNERDRARSTDELHEVIANLRAKIRADSGSAFETEIWIRKNVTGFLRLPVADIQSVTAEDDYVRINTAERSYLLRSTLGDLQAKLDPEQFFRIHRSAIVRRASVVEFKREGAGLHAYLTNGDRLRVGRVYAKLIRPDLTRLER